MSDKQINETSIVFQTIDVLYQTTFSNDKKIGFVLYNDQFDKQLASRAHAKGIIIFDEKSAIWIAHSIPHFPPKQTEKQFDVNEEQLKFGQSMICLSLPFEALSQVGLQLLYAYPQVYDFFIPKSMESNPVLANLNEVVKDKRVKSEPWSNVETLKTIGDKEFLTFYKHAKFGQDLYLNLVARDLNTNLFTETWSRGVGTNDSDCSLANTVHNIQEINFEEFNVNFPVTNDHSKWAINQPRKATEKKYVCIGDINRQQSQTKRGGGTICFVDNEKVWNEYYGIISEVEPCEGESRVLL